MWQTRCISWITRHKNDYGSLLFTYKTLKTTWFLHKHVQVQVWYVEYMLYTKFIYNHLISLKLEPVLIIQPLTIVSPGNLSATGYWHIFSDWQYTLHIINIKMKLMFECLVNETMTIARQTKNNMYNEWSWWHDALCCGLSYSALRSSTLESTIQVCKFSVVVSFS